MKHSLRVAMAALLSVTMLGAATGASAQASASSSFGAFRLQIVDLTPYDGVEAGVRFLDGSTGAYALLRDDSGGVRDSAQAGSAGGPIQVLIDTADSHLASNATLTSASSLVSIMNGSGETFTDIFRNFVLAPHTEVTFSIDAVANASAPGTPGLFSYVAINGVIRDDNGIIVVESDGLSSDIASSDTLSVTLNSAGAELTGWLEFATAAYAQVPAVPEPTSMAMLAAGLAIVGRLARRCAAACPCPCP